jgi:hypothetical protein
MRQNFREKYQSPEKPLIPTSLVLNSGRRLNILNEFLLLPPPLQTTGGTVPYDTTPPFSTPFLCSGDYERPITTTGQVNVGFVVDKLPLRRISLTTSNFACLYHSTKTPRSNLNYLSPTLYSFGN